jgi:Skp family chaperone for outer membrane proteins
MKRQNQNILLSGFMNFSIAFLILAIGFFIGNLFSASPTMAAGNVVGFVNVEELLEKHPSKEKVISRLADYEQNELQKLEPYTKQGLTSDEKKKSLELSVEVRDKIKAKRRELLEPLYLDIIEKAKKTGRDIGVEVVLDGVVVFYGGIDLTPAIYNKLDPNL